MQVKNNKNTAERIHQLNQNRKPLLERIQQIEARLISGYSRPLEDSLNDLLKKDMKIICSITNELTNIS